MKKNLIDRIQKVRCQTMMVNEIQTLYPLNKRIEDAKYQMYERIIQELKKEKLVKEEIEDTEDYKIIKMELLVVEPELDEEENY